MLYKGIRRFVFAGSISLLLFLAVMNGLAMPSGDEDVYLPLVILQRAPPTPSTSGKLLITELLYNPLSEPAREPAGEWVEIYNPGDGPILLSAFKIGDEETFGGSEGMMQFPAGVVLEPGGVVVVANKGTAFQTMYGFPPDFEFTDTDPTIPDMLPYFAWSTGKVEWVNSGDEVLLLDENDTLIPVDALSWGSSTIYMDPPPPPAGDGESLERSPAYGDTDSAGDWVIAETPGPYQLDLSTPTPTVSPTPEIPTGPTTLLVSEVLYDPSGDNPEGEWIEIYNAGENNALLSDYRVGDEETQGAGEGMYFFPPGFVLFSQETAVIANQAVAFEENYGFKPDFEITDTDSAVPDMIKDTDWSSGSMNLSASGDEVLILVPDNSLVDGVSWGSSTVILDPAVSNVETGHSIERYPPNFDTDTALDWRDQPSPDPGELDLTPPTLTPSPTFTSTPEPLPDLIINEIHADPAGDLSGDANGDGIRDSSDDEFVEIVNTTEDDILIGGWMLRDGDQVRHVFTDTTVIPAGCAIVVFGGGTPTGDFGGSLVQVASTGRLSLNNSGGETITLQNAASVIVDEYSYSSADDDQSITRDPDITGPDPMVKHSDAIGANGALFSPGTMVNGSSFPGCSSTVLLKKSTHRKSWPASPEAGHVKLV